MNPDAEYESVVRLCWRKAQKIITITVDFTVDESVQKLEHQELSMQLQRMTKNL